MEESMNYPEFKMFLMSKISERVGSDTQVCIRKVPKNNGVLLDGLTIRHKERNVAPTIYVENYWQKYLDGCDEEHIVDMILLENREYSVDRDIDIDDFLDFGKMRDKVMYKLINFEMNRDFLDTVPMRRVLDLAVVYYYRVDAEGLYGATCVIRKEDMERWKTDEEELWRLATVNTPRNEPANIRSMCECLLEYCAMQIEEDPRFRDNAEHVLDMAGISPMYILSNTSQVFGAACILYPETMKDVSLRLGSDFYVLPSSVHEVILMPADKGYDSEDLSEMVREVNASDVMPHEILSDHVYRYYADRGVIML
jgi:hypothetical protein